MLIYLNGTSSSGKTALALELQKLIQKPVVYFSIDTILYSLAEEDLKAIMGKQPCRHPLDWNSIFLGYFSCVRSLIQAGNRVIADCPIHNENLAKYFDHFISAISNKVLIKVDCLLSTLEARETARGDRAIGVAKKQAEGIHKYLKYDLEVQTDRGPASVLAGEIYLKLKSII